MTQQQTGQGGTATPQYSSDGRWRWDGAGWAPVQQPPAGAPGPGPSRRRRRWPWVVGAVAVLSLIGIAAAASSSGSPQKAAGTPAASPTQAALAATQAPAARARPAATAAPPAAPKVLLDLTGNGIKNSDQFDAPGHWKLHYTFDCSAFGSQGNFAVTVYQGSDPVDLPVNELSANGDSTSDVYNGGQLHLQINSECTWHVTATAA